MQEGNQRSRNDPVDSQRGGGADRRDEVSDFRDDYQEGGRRGRGRGGAHKSDNWREDRRDRWASQEGDEGSSRGRGNRGRGRGRGSGYRGRGGDYGDDYVDPNANVGSYEVQEGGADDGARPYRKEAPQRRDHDNYNEGRSRGGYGARRGGGGSFQDRPEGGGSHAVDREQATATDRSAAPDNLIGNEDESAYGNRRGGYRDGPRGRGREFRSGGQGRGGYGGRRDDYEEEAPGNRPFHRDEERSDRPYRAADQPRSRQPQRADVQEEEKGPESRAAGGSTFHRVQRAAHLRKNCYDEEEVLALFNFHHRQQGISLENYSNIPVEMVPRDIMAVENFSELTVDAALTENIARCGYSKPTPVQRYGIPVALSGNDLMACAQTGSGKTAAFLIPVVQHILLNGVSPMRNRVCLPIAVVMAPTRELALQIYDEVRKLTFRTDIFHDVVYGGTPYPTRLENDILVACPGRLKDIFDRGQLSFKAVKFLILDEADRMLEMGFEEQIEYLVASRYSDMRPPEERQTLMFSATFPQRILSLAKRYLRKQYYLLTVGRVGSTTKNITQVIERVRSNQKVDRLFELIYAHKQTDLVLVFVETKKAADDLHRELKRENIPSATIHGDRRQADRERALQDFKTGVAPILVATDVAARGLDIPDVAHVIQFDLPREMDDYTHRIGRTGRAGNKGTATAFYSPDDRHLCLDLFRYFKEHDQSIPDWFQREKDEMEGEAFLSMDRGYGGGGGRRRGGGGGGGGGGDAPRDRAKPASNSTWGEGGRSRGGGRNIMQVTNIDDGGF